MKITLEHGLTFGAGLLVRGRVNDGPTLNVFVYSPFDIPRALINRNSSWAAKAGDDSMSIFAAAYTYKWWAS